MELSSDHPPLEPRPISGWALARILDLDDAEPGLLSFTCRASPVRRQLVFLALAKMDHTRTGALPAEATITADSPVPVLSVSTMAQAMRTGRVRDLVTALCGSVPLGFRGALARLGDDPLPEPALYDSLFRLYADPANRRRAQALRHCERIDARLIRVVERVDDPLLLDPHVLKQLETPERARDLGEALAYFRQAAGADDTTLREALRAAPPYGLSKFLKQWIERVERLPSSPLDGQPDFVPLNTATLLLSKAK